MGLFDKLKKKKAGMPKEAPAKPEIIMEPSANTMLCVLFDQPSISTEEFESAIIGKFGREALVQTDSSRPSATHYMLRIDGLDLMCSYMPFPFPGDEADIPALVEHSLYITEEEQAALLGQKSFCLVTQIGGGATLEGKRAVCLLLSRFCGALLQLKGAAGVYYSAASLLLGKAMYLKHTAIIEEQRGDPDYFPSILWVLVYPTRTEDGSPTIETLGLEQFGFLELMFYKPTEEWAESFEKLYIMSLLQITGKELYKNMDTISFTEDGLSIFKQSGKKLTVIGGI